MTSLPIAVMYSGGHLIPLASHKRMVADQFGEGEVLTISVVEESSHASRGHYFALLNQAWMNLPEAYAERFPTPEHLRKWCLVKAGWRDERTVVCGSKAEAERVAAFVRPIDDYAIVVAREATVTVWTAKSQSLRAMGRADFQASKDATLQVLSDLIGTDVTTLHHAA